MIGALCTSGKTQDLPTGKWNVSFGYRYQVSSRHFVGTVEQKQRELLRNQIENIYHMFDVGVSYDVSPRWTVHASLPMFYTTRDQLYPPRGFYKVGGIGDLSVGARAWIFRPPTESGGNVSLGFGFKFPTGPSDIARDAIGRNGQPVRAVADQSIQLGDGGYGFAVDTQAYKRIPWRNTLYFSGTYLFNPQNTSGVPTFRIRAGEEIMSISDQYLFRGGVSHAVRGVRGLAVSIGGRIEGVPVRDAFGSSDGFRRPGYAISVDPGMVYNRGKNFYSLNIPFAVERNRRRSVTDIRNGFHGDAAFADFTITLSVSRRF